ncbi:MAG: DUF3152 domain-containing protein [Micromonosporaceae bacterium]|nr:DUF3152 domain-containing protein [Micromonosporaceae bacterium]
MDQVQSLHRRLLRRPRRTLIVVVAGLLAVAGPVIYVNRAAEATAGIPIESLDGHGNNVANPTWGQAGTDYARLLPPRYADGRSQPVSGPNARLISNRIFNDNFQNIFSENRISQWGWTWGQFLDHTFGLAQSGTQTANIPFNSSDPMESFTDTLGSIPFTRDAAAPGTGTNSPRQTVNTVNSYIDAWAVYGGTNDRLEWLRDGPVDGNLGNNAATLRLPGGYLPRADSRGNATTAPTMAVDGRLLANPGSAMVAGDVRANENLALTATQTLFAREHNRIVSLLPNTLSNEDKFQIARRIVIAEQQFITYNEFLPAMGVPLPQYRGYNPGVKTSLTQEFATVGYRAHSQIHGEFTTADFPASRYSQAQLAALKAAGVEVTVDGSNVSLTIPLNVALFNPDILPLVGEGPMLSSLSEQEYQNDEQMDNGLRSVLFQVPTPTSDPSCVDETDFTPCFTGVEDLGAIDIERGRDHGLGSYNQLRRAYGLPPVTSFTQITGESTDQFPAGTNVNDPNSLDFLNASDLNGAPLAVGEADGTVHATRRTTVAARLRAIYGSVNKVDAFVGMMAEKHLPGSEFGPLQERIWERQFQALRDGDRFFYGNDQGLSQIEQKYGIDFHTTLAQVIARNSDIPAADINPNAFIVADDDLPPANCAVDYQLTNNSSGQFQVNLKITNLTNKPVDGWRLRWQFSNGQAVASARNGNASQNGINAAVSNDGFNATIPAGGSVDGVSLNGGWDGVANAVPINFTLNNQRCAVSDVDPPTPSPSPSPPASVDPSPSPSASATDFPHQGPGTFRYATGTGPVLGRPGATRFRSPSTLLRYRVALESNVSQVNLDQLATKVDTVLGDSRSWIASGAVQFQRVPAGTPANFTIYLATEQTASQMCRAGGVSTGNTVTSCQVGDRVVLSLDQWLQSVPAYTQANVSLDTYRTFAINHEVGHVLGYGHQSCPGAGRPAPVMEQQSLGLGGCTANPWPYLNGRLYVGPPSRS